MRPHKLGICAALALMLALLCAFGAAADTTVGMTGAGTFRMEQAYVNVPELDVYFYALDGPTSTRISLLPIYPAMLSVYVLRLYPKSIESEPQKLYRLNNSIFSSIT